MIYVLLFILGCCIGSFVNVMFTRKDWYKGRSRCDECGYILKWYDLIPVFSFLILRGKCRKCKTKIDCSHLISELMMGAAFLVGSLCFKLYGITFGTLAFVSLLCIAVAAIEDYKEQMVYGAILLIGMMLTFGMKLGFLIYDKLYIEAMIFVTSVVVIKLIAVIASKVFSDKIGAGDFDILIIIYILGDLYGLVSAVTYASVAGCLIYLPAIVMKKRDKKDPLPFIPLLLLGTMVFLVI